MRSLILKMHISVDGFVAGADGAIDWIFKTTDPEGRAWTVETISNAGAHLMGSRTFRDMASYWPKASDAFAAPMNEIPKVVFSRTGLAATATTRALEDATRLEPGADAPVSAAIAESWTNPTVASGDLSDEIARLKQQDGKPLLAHGGARFAQSLVRLGLVDEYHLAVHPVALGRGLALFSALERPLALEMISTKTFKSGTIARIFRPAPLEPG